MAVLHVFAPPCGLGYSGGLTVWLMPSVVSGLAVWLVLVVFAPPCGPGHVVHGRVAVSLLVSSHGRVAVPLSVVPRRGAWVLSWPTRAEEYDIRICISGTESQSCASPA